MTNIVIYRNDKDYSDCIHIGFPSSTQTRDIYWYKYKTPQEEGETRQTYRHISQNRYQYTPPNIDIREKPIQIQYGAYGGRQEGSRDIFDLDEFVLEEENTTLSLTTCWLYMSLNRRQLDRLSQILYLFDSDEYRATPASANKSRAIICQIRGLNLYKNPCLHLFYLNVAYTLVSTISIPYKYHSR